MSKDKTSTSTSTSRTTVTVGRVDKRTGDTTIRTGSTAHDQLMIIRTGR